ncbi:SnoaL-like domain-containing protein [Sphingorhabdus profundilacus]|uniref:SnoaL-like domain-containing protein n=1 Tax=Sphingorhabdus profundilacus TaxID=2509718 RepID=UPI0013656B75
MAVIDDVARDFTAMLRLDQFEAAGEKFWAIDVKSAEPAALSQDIPALVSGREAALRKTRARFAEADIDDLRIDGPFVTGDQFALFLDMLITDPATGKTQPFAEIAIFTVRDGRIIEERFFYD